MPQITEAAEELEERRQEYERKLEQQRKANHPRRILRSVEAPTASIEYDPPLPVLVPAHATYP